MELKGTFVIFLIFALSFYGSDANPIQPFVVNGTDATIEEFPFMVIQRKK